MTGQALDAVRGSGRVSVRAVDGDACGNGDCIRFLESDYGTLNVTGRTLNDDVCHHRNHLTCASVGVFVMNLFLGILSDFRAVSDEIGNTRLRLLFLLHMI